jgi:dipeptidyl-peptidase-4
MGMSVAPVADLHYYDTIYQERYVGLPQDNPEVYRVGSPVTFAGQLKGDLLVVHGSGDDNVHYQNTEALVNALVKANKPFQLMVYPNRTHCICEGEGTSLHLYSLLTRYLTEHLPTSEVPRTARGSRFVRRLPSHKEQSPMASFPSSVVLPSGRHCGASSPP